MNNMDIYLYLHLGECVVGIWNESAVGFVFRLFIIESAFAA